MVAKQRDARASTIQEWSKCHLNTLQMPSSKTFNDPVSIYGKMSMQFNQVLKIGLQYIE